jgi:hypothetical protein
MKPARLGSRFPSINGLLRKTLAQDLPPGHLRQQEDDTSSSLKRKRLPHILTAGLAHDAILSSVWQRTERYSQESATRSNPSTYKRHLQWDIEAAFKNLKDDLQLRPIHHQLEQRIEAHIFVAFLAYCLHVTLRARLKPLAAGLTPRAVLDKFAAIQMLDVHFPTTDGRTLILRRHTEPNTEQKMLLRQLGLDLPPQPLPRITAPNQKSI